MAVLMISCLHVESFSFGRSRSRGPRAASPRRATHFESSSSSLSNPETRMPGAYAQQDNDNDDDDDANALFQEIVDFLATKQVEIIGMIEGELEESSGAKFSRDEWGSPDYLKGDKSGGITRVLQGGHVIEKGACSLTVIRNGVLTRERAESMVASRGGAINIKEGDTYHAAALSMVLHSLSPMIPTFRSDVRIFYVEGVGAFLGGGADLTPYYLFDDDICEFHNVYKSLSDETHSELTECNYAALKQQCDEYFYLPARSEHRGVGGIFFDHVPATATSMAFLKDVTSAWMPSWFPICQRRRDLAYSDDQKHWQLLRRGRYLEFNLLYDRGVQFGLAKANPRVEAVMVSAPPRIAWDYNPTIVPGSEEARLVEVLKAPRDWAK